MLFLPGFFNIPPIDRDEARFAQATKQMVESGDFVDIRFQDDVRYKKPVGIYWMQAAVVETARRWACRGAGRIWLYRIPSLIGAIGAVLLTYWTALAFVTRRGAISGRADHGAVRCCSASKRGWRKPMPCCCSRWSRRWARWRGSICRGSAARIPARPPWSWPAIFWTALAGGVLLKGPLILLFVALTIVTLAILDRSAAWLWRLRPVWGLMWLLVLVLPWFVAIFWRAGETFFTNSVGRDMLAKFAAQESHGAPPGLYLLLFWVTFWPGAALAGMAAPAVWRARREPGAQYLLAWLMPSWIVFELVMTKLPHYVLPLYPAIAILTVGALERRVLSRSWLMRGAAWWFVIPAGASVLAVVGAIALTRQPVFLAWPFIAAALIFGLFAWWLYEDSRAERSLLNAVVSAMFLAIAIYGIVLPLADAAVPEPRNRSRAAQRRLRRTESRRRGLPRAEPRLHDRDLDAADGRVGCGGFPGAGQLQVCAGRSRARNAASPRAPKPSGCATTWPPASTAINFSQGKAISIAIFRSEGTE